MPALNPIMPGFNPDPSICRVGKDYFLATSTFEFFPGVPIYHSTDLVNWTLICHALSRPSQLNMRAVPMSCGVWAPTLRYHKGRWYMTTTVMHQISSDDYCPRAFYVYTDNIWDESSWSDPIWTQMHGIDPDLFFDDDGRVYLSSAPVCGPHHGITSDPLPHLITMGCEIDIRTGRSLTPSIILRVSEYGRKIAEGPHIYKKDGWYYLLTAEGGTQEHHRAMITRARSPLGPYEEPPEGVNPVIFNDQDPHVRHTGHADIFEGSDGRWWATCLGIRPQENGIAPLLRETFLTPLEWKDGWPVIPDKIRLEIPAELPERAPRGVWRDEFDHGKLSPGWYHIRTPLGHAYSLTAHPGQLALYPGGFRLDDYECPSALLRKQITLSGVWTTRMTYEPGSDHEEAGAVMYVSAVSYVSMFVRRARKGEGEGEGAGKVMVVRYPEGGSGFKEDIRPLSNPSGPIEMKIAFTALDYTFSFAEVASTGAGAGDELQWIEMLKLTTAALHEPRDLGAFTGPHFGMFAQTINEPGRGVALFDYAQHDFGE